MATYIDSKGTVRLVTAEFMASVAERINDGVSPRTIAQDLGRSHEWLYGNLHRHGWQPQTRKGKRQWVNVDPPAPIPVRSSESAPWQQFPTHVTELTPQVGYRDISGRVLLRMVVQFLTAKLLGIRA